MSMAKATMGLFGKIITWVMYIFLFYSLTTAYVAGGGELFMNLFDVSRGWAITLFVCIFGLIVYFGAKAVDRVNLLLMLGLSISYLFFVFAGIQNVKVDLLQHQHWGLSLLALPVIFTSFGFQGLVPSLCVYLKRNIKNIRLSIIIGSSIPLLVYIVWQALVLGIIPLNGVGGLKEAFIEGSSVIRPLQKVLENSWLSKMSSFFAFFALVTSFLGVTLGLFDFLADALSFKKDHRGKCALSILVFVIPSTLAYWDTHIFIIALQYAGGYGCALLLGLLPIVMVWVARYKIRLSDSGYRVWGGKPLLFILATLVLIVIAKQVTDDYSGVKPMMEDIQANYSTSVE